MLPRNALLDMKAGVPRELSAELFEIIEERDGLVESVLALAIVLSDFFSIMPISDPRGFCSIVVFAQRVKLSSARNNAG